MGVIIGIDIGLTGAVAALGHGIPTISDLPTVPDGKSGKRIDGRALILLLRQMVPADGHGVAVIEDVRPRPNPTRGTSIVTEGSLMRSRGIVEAVCDVMRMPMVVVQPQAWKRHFGLLKTKKGASLDMARTLYPAQMHDLRRAKDQNRAEALLIAHYGAERLAE